MRLSARLACAILLLAAPAWGQPSSEPDTEDPPLPAESRADDYPDPPLSMNGYVDFGFVDAQGDGTSFAPGDTRIPADYVADPFATPVNSRGDVASVEAGRFVNGFLPRSVGIGGKPSFLLNVVNQDVRYSLPGDRVLVFARAQLLPRYTAAGNETRVLVEQAFARVVPFPFLEMALSVGKFDSVVGIEYLENPANLRTGIAPSLLARYTTGQAVGAKLFYRAHLPALWSSLSFHLAGTNAGSQVEALQPVDVSLTGRPVFAGRVGYELNLPSLQVKLGASGLRGPRNDQTDPGIRQTLWGVDGRIHLAGLTLSGEWISFREDRGTGAKFTGQGPHVVASGFWTRGFWVALAYRWALPLAAGTAVAPYARVERRRAQFEGYPRLESRRLTVGLRLDFGYQVAIKGEWLFNREAEGALPVDNDLLLTSAIFSW